MFVQNMRPETEKLEKVAFILKTIAHPLRLSIIDLLVKQGSLSVGQLCKQLGAEQSLTSHHLSVMREKGVLNTIREGKNVLYSINLMEVVQVIKCVENCEIPTK